MSREILFRGKRVDNGEWMHGDLLHTNGKQSIGEEFIDGFEGDSWIEHLVKEVIPETVGQYTGLKDKNDVRVFEGDLVVLDDDFERNDYPIVWDNSGFWAIGGGYDAPLCDQDDNECLEVVRSVHGPK